MGFLSDFYRPSLTLLTDLYQLTMAYGYWSAGMADVEAVFHLFFRRNPFEGGYGIAAGLESAVDFLSHFGCSESDIAYLAGVTGNDEKPLFPPLFLEQLRSLSLSCDVDAVPEGTIVQPHEPLIRVRGPLLNCQLIETALLNIINFQTLIATKAARVCEAAAGEPVLEFGLRRAQGIDGGVSASRAAYLGGCAATSNVLAGKLFGIPIRGTHAHSWVMAFENEMEAFETYARCMPNNCVFLVDTYESLHGVRRAAEMGKQLRERGHRMVGIRLDSGDLVPLSVEARKILDHSGLEDSIIVASNNLDEHVIQDLKQKGAQVDVWGVGTRLATAYDQPALGGVYKLSALRRPGGPWEYKLKLSEQTAKINNPGQLQVRRFRRNGQFWADVIFDQELGIDEGCAMVELNDAAKRLEIPAGTPFEDLLEPVLRRGRCVAELPSLDVSRERAQRQLRQLHPDIKRLDRPESYPVGLEEKLHELKGRLISEAGGK